MMCKIKILPMGNLRHLVVILLLKHCSIKIREGFFFYLFACYFKEKFSLNIFPFIPTIEKF